MRALRPLGVALVLLLAAPADATQVVELTNAQLVQASTAVVYGVVESRTTSLHAAGPGVFTDYLVRVDQHLAGVTSGGMWLTVRVPGGEGGGRHVVVDGMPELEVGAEVVLFLEALPTRPFGGELVYLPVGLSQGVWSREGALWRRGDQHGLLHNTAPPDAFGALTWEELLGLCRTPSPVEAPEPGVAP